MESWTDQVVIEGVIGHGSPARFLAKTTPETVPRYHLGHIGNGDRPSEQEIRGEFKAIPQSLILDVACLARKTRSDISRRAPGTLNGPSTANSSGSYSHVPITTLMPIWTRKNRGRGDSGVDSSLGPGRSIAHSPAESGASCLKSCSGKTQSRDLEFQKYGSAQVWPCVFQCQPVRRKSSSGWDFPPESLEIFDPGVPP